MAKLLHKGEFVGSACDEDLAIEVGLQRFSDGCKVIQRPKFIGIVGSWMEDDPAPIEMFFFFGF